MDDARAFEAPADPTRRRLLDLLFLRDGRTPTELASEFAMSRFGVSRHLGVAEAAALITARKSGREKLRFLNPVPIQLIHDRWVSKYTRARAEALADLNAALESGGRKMGAVAPSHGGWQACRTQLVCHVFIKAAAEPVWEGITNPAFTSRHFHGARIEGALTPGAALRHAHGDGTPLAAGEVLEADPPRRLVYTWRAQWAPELADDPATRVTWEIEVGAPGVTKLTLIHDRFTGETATHRAVAGGWMFVLSALKTRLETGAPLRPADVEQVPGPGAGAGQYDPATCRHRPPPATANASPQPPSAITGTPSGVVKGRGAMLAGAPVRGALRVVPGPTAPFTPSSRPVRSTCRVYGSVP